MPATAQFAKKRKLWLGGFDLSGNENDMSLSLSYEDLPAEVWGDSTRVKIPGLQVVDLMHRGYIAHGLASIEEVLSTRLKAYTVDELLSIGSQNGLSGETGFFFNSGQISLQRVGKVGSLETFECKAINTKADLIRGIILEDDTVNKTVTGNGTGRQVVGGLLTGKKVYGGLHVVAIPGGTNPTLDLKIQSDDNAGFSSPTDRITFTQKTARGSEFVTGPAGPITEEYWRATWTIGGTASPTFKIVVVFGFE